MSLSTEKVIPTLVNRLGEKLPCNCGKLLDLVEADPLVQRTVEAIVELSEFRLGHTVLCLATLLDSVTKNYMMASPDEPQLKYLQSQLLLLRVLGACLAHYWNGQRKSRGVKCERLPSIYPRENWTSHDEAGDHNHKSDKPSPATSNGTQNAENGLQNLDDPLPLEESTAKSLMTILSFSLQAKNSEASEITTAAAAIADASSSVLAANSTTNLISSLKHSNSAAYNTFPSGPQTTDTLSDILAAAARIYFYLSAANWSIILGRLRGRLQFFTTVNDENMDLSEFRFLEWCNINGARLSGILKEVSQYMLHMKRSAQSMLANVIRKVIWNWIDVYPLEFICVCNGSLRIEGSDVLFDLCNSFAESAKKKTAFWPLQNILLIISPEVLVNSLLGDNKIAKKSQFLDTIRKSIRGSRLTDVAAVSCVDICKALTYLPNSESSLLWQMIPDLENVLKDNLFDINKPFTTGDNVIEQRLMTDCLTALYRLSPINTLRTLMPVCMNENAPMAFKIVLVKSCLAIASEENRSPWSPSVTSIAPNLASFLKQLFQDNLRDRVYDVSRKAATLDKKTRRIQMEEASDKSEIIMNILRLYHTEPNLAIVCQNQTPDAQVEENRVLIVGVTACLANSVLGIRTKAAQTLLALHLPKYIERWGPPSGVMRTFWRISSQVMLSIARQMLEYKEREDGARYALELLLQLVAHRNNFLTIHNESALVGVESSDRMAASIAVEIALLIFLCSPETEICSMAVTCLGHLCTEASLTDDADDPQHSQLTIVENLAGYRELASPGVLVTGRVAQQKRIRKILREMKCQTPGNVGAWEEAYKRWRVLVQSLYRFSDEPNAEDKAEWQNYCGFLCSLGGCLTSNIGTTSMRSGHDSMQMVNRFLQEMTELLISDTVMVRETVKETMGADLSPKLYAILFQQLENKLARLNEGDSEPGANDKYRLFVEQAISVLKLMLERIQESGEYSTTVDLGSLILSFGAYLNRLGTGHVALRIKVKMCQLVEVVMQKKDCINFKQEIKFRNNLLETIIEFLSDFALKSGPDSSCTPEDMYKNDKLQRDLDGVCMKAVVSLLYQLPLQPAQCDLDMAQAKSQLFFKYHSFFIKLLNRCRVLEVVDTGAFSTKNNADLQQLLLKSKESVRDLGPLKDYTILALSNLLSANIESGLKYSFSMGYHEDTKTRTAFMQVLTNILQQGTEFEGLGENVLSDRYSKLVDSVTDVDLCIALSLSEVCAVRDADEVASLLLTIFDSRNEVMRLLQAVITREISMTESPSDIFRRNSMATRMLTTFARQQGAEYLRTTLQFVLEDLFARGGQMRFELDPTKANPGEDISKNAEHLKAVCQNFLRAITNSGPNVPRSFREVCHFISNAVAIQFPDAETTAIGGFIFLRFFCPAIVAPEASDLVQQTPSKDVRRALLLVAKVIQSLANNVLFGAKEAFMTVINEFLTANMQIVTNFLQELAIVPPAAPDPNVPISQIGEDHVRRLHRLLFDHIEQIGRDVNTRKQANIKSPDDDQSYMQARKAYDKLSTLLAQLGPPPDTPKSELAGVGTKKAVMSNQLFRDFMQKNANRNVDGIRMQNLFFEAGNSKEKRPVFFFIARRLNVETTDMELLIYYILKTLEPFIRKPYELVIDASLFDQPNEVQNEWASQFMQILPNDAVQNFATLYIYNLNSHFKKYCNKLLHTISIKLRKHTHFLNSVSELNDYIPGAREKLPKSTVALETEAATFSPVTRVSHRIRTPVILKISSETIQVTMIKKQEAMGLSATVKDIYAISSIDDVAIVPHRSETDLFLIKYDRGKSSIIFSSPRRDDIVQAILASKVRFHMSGPTSGTDKPIRPTDLQPTLLNMALLNIGSDDPHLRLAAYNLLYALSLAFDFDVGNHLLIAKGLCIPANSTGFVTSMSNMLAQTEPHLTLEFLRECFVGFNKSSADLKHLCLEYTVPWLPNLATFCSNGNVEHLEKTREIVKFLIDLTVKETSMYHSVQSKIWYTLGKVDQMVQVLLDAFVQYAAENGAGSSQAEAMADITVTLQSVTVPGKIISRLRKVIARTSLKPSSQLVQHAAWTEISVLVRFLLMLSFNNRLHVQDYLPELWHIVTLLVATGSVWMRASIHGLVVNIIQSLCTSMLLSEADLKSLSALLEDFAEPKFRLLFGLHRSNANAFTVNQEPVDSTDSISLSSLETVVHSLIDVMACGAPSVEVSNKWRARWMSLVSSTAFQFNPAVQPRAFVAMGCLAKDEVDDDLLYQILVALRGSLTLFDENDCDLIISVVLCLTKIVENLPQESRYLQHMFWISMSLLQIGHLALMASALQLMHVTLKTLDARGFFARDSPKTFLMAMRQPIGDIEAQIEQLTGTQFQTEFAFALSATLLKGLKHPSTKACTVAVLTCILELSSKHSQIASGKVDAELLGYLAPLLPIMASKGNAELKGILWLMDFPDLGMEGSEPQHFSKLFECLVIPDRTTAVLLISMMVTILNASDYDEELYFIYSFLAEAALVIPDVLPLFFDGLLNKINHILANSQTSQIVQAIESLLFRATSASGSQGRSKRTEHAYLAEIGFSGLQKAGAFQPIAKSELLRRSQLASILVERVIS